MRTGHSLSKPARRRRRGFSYLELLIASLLLVLAATGAMAHWRFSLQATATKRVTEMGVYVGVHALERLKTLKYTGLPETGAPLAAGSTPVEWWYDRQGQPAGAAQARGYRARGWISTWIDRDGIANTEDVRLLTVQVTDNAGTVEYERIRTLLTFGGI
ncbi:MAG: hypothetical protein ACK47B_01800 [Armatimonadota bacterium]